MTFLKFAIAAVLACFVLALPADAQMGALTSTAAPEQSVDVPDLMTAEEVDTLIALLSDIQVRQVLRDMLIADAVDPDQAAAGGGGILTDVTQIVTHIYDTILDAVAKIPLLVTEQLRSFSAFADRYDGPNGLAVLFGLIAVSLAVGLALERVLIFATRAWQKEIPAEDTATLGDALNFLFRRFMREIVGLIGFYVGLRVIGTVLMNDHQLAFAGPFVFYLIWLPRIGNAVARLVLAPHRSDLRLVNIRDQQAKYLARNLTGLILLAGFTVFIGQFNESNGVPLEAARLGFWLNLAVHVYIAWIAWRGREGLSDMMRGSDVKDNTAFDEAVARIFPYFAIALSAAMWVLVYVVDSFGQTTILVDAPHYDTMFWLLVTPVLDTFIRGLVGYLQPPMIGEGAVAEAAYKSTKRSFIRIGRVLVAGIVLMIIADAWQVDLVSLSGSETIGANFFQFMITLAIGYVLFECIALWTNRRLAREHTSASPSEDQAAGEGGGVGGTRLATVLPLVRVTAQVGVAVVFVLLALGNLGIDITPLLAGAGILGLAIGFGAQKLVADIVGGIFFLIDDAFRVGEYIDVGGTAGTVEKISIRSMQLRHHRGSVHTIPYGEIPKLTNYSRDWVIMKLKFTVPFDTDPNKIKKIFKKIGAEMMADDIHKDGFLEPFKSQGVFDFDDVGMVVRGKFMAKPGQQFTIRKEIYNRVKQEFGQAGIDFARREVRVAIPTAADAHDDSGADADTGAPARPAASAPPLPPAEPGPA